MLADGAEAGDREATGEPTMPLPPYVHVTLSPEDRQAIEMLAKAHRMTVTDGMALGIGFMLAPVVIVLVAYAFIYVINAIA